ncbi:MAG TPA: multiheme c-type cytochrome [Candidatus Acidoferrum sp.]|jgi:hypothetical protein
MRRGKIPGSLSEPAQIAYRSFASRLSRFALIFAGVAVPLLVLGGTLLHFEGGQGKGCVSCHEIWQPYSDWHDSAHRNVSCADCHGNVFTLDAGFHVKNMRRAFAHLSGDAPEKPRLKSRDVLQMVARCQQCHREEYADWSSGGHSATYSDIFLSSEHNHREVLMDDCLRCHGMHFEGGIRDLVGPLNTAGPWRLSAPELANQPVVPCLSCHQLHQVGAPHSIARIGSPTPGPKQETNRPSVGLFDRRELAHVPVSELPLPKLFEGMRTVKMSPDQRQALCYQCHAPLATQQVYSGDDRTPIGVHEGLSCMACHLKHGQQTRPSCSTCHPRLSNCGIAAETMDTSFKDRSSKHNIHSVKCTDCHTKGVPRKTGVVYPLTTGLARLENRGR